MTSAPSCRSAITCRPLVPALLFASAAHTILYRCPLDSCTGAAMHAAIPAVREGGTRMSKRWRLVRLHRVVPPFS